MKLWLLSPRKTCPGHYCGVGRLIVREETQQLARNRAAEGAGLEGDSRWRNPDFSSCQELASLAPDMVIIINLRAEGEAGILVRD